MSCDDSRAQQEEERLLFPGKDLANEKPWTLFCFVLFCFVFYYIPPNFISPSKKAFSLPCCGWTCTGLTMVADPELQFSADPE